VNAVLAVDEDATPPGVPLGDLGVLGVPTLQNPFPVQDGKNPFFSSVTRALASLGGKG